MRPLLRSMTRDGSAHRREGWSVSLSDHARLEGGEFERPFDLEANWGQPGIEPGTSWGRINDILNYGG
jgi:hypothetical protein